MYVRSIKHSFDMFERKKLSVNKLSKIIHIRVCMAFSTFLMESTCSTLLAFGIGQDDYPLKSRQKKEGEGSKRYTGRTTRQYMNENKMTEECERTN